MQPLINIFIDTKNEKFDFWNLDDWGEEIAFIKAKSLPHFGRILKSLHADTKILIWLHLRVSEKPDAPPGFFDGQKLLSQYPNIKKLIYVTAGGDNNFSFKRSKDVICGQNEIPFIINREKPLLVRDILWPTYKTVDDISFAKGEYDWRVRSLQLHLDNKTLRNILATAINPGYSKYIIDVLQPGYSGAYILKIEAIEQLRSFFFLLKISKNPRDLLKELEFANAHYTSNLNNQVFITSFRTKELEKIFDWYCLLFRFEKDKTTAREFLADKVLALESITKYVQRIFAAFQVFYEETSLDPQPHNNFYYAKHLPPFLGGEFSHPHKDRYHGLSIKINKITKIFQTINWLNEMVSPNKLKALKIEENLIYFKAFLKEMQFNGCIYKSHSIEKYEAAIVTPLGKVHGDFHTANILVDKGSQNPSFIDFANVSKTHNQHAFLDWGKFSSDLEISVLPDQWLNDHPNHLPTWMACHKKWTNLDTDDFDTIPKPLKIIFEASTFIRTELIAQHKSNMDTEEIIRQFYMVRLHYFLKALSYKVVCREKLLYCIRASIDILEYLIKK